MPLIVKISPAEKSRQETAQDQAERREKASTDTWSIRLTAGLLAIGLLQAIVLVVQTRVFYVQAGRLKETIDTMKTIDAGQSSRVDQSLAHAASAATAATQQSIAAQTNINLIRKIELPNLVIAGAVEDNNAVDIEFRMQDFTPIISYINVGARPAIVTAEYIRFWISEKRPGEGSGTRWRRAFTHPQIVQSLNTIEITRIAADPESESWIQDVDDFLTGKKDLWVWGYIEYKGFTEETTRTRFRYIVAVLDADEFTAPGSLDWRSVPYDEDEIEKADANLSPHSANPMVAAAT